MVQVTPTRINVIDMYACLCGRNLPSSTISQRCTILSSYRIPNLFNQWHIFPTTQFYSSTIHCYTHTYTYVHTLDINRFGILHQRAHYIHTLIIQKIKERIQISSNFYSPNHTQISAFFSITSSIIYAFFPKSKILWLFNLHQSPSFPCTTVARGRFFCIVMFVWRHAKSEHILFQWHTLFSLLSSNHHKIFLNRFCRKDSH